MLETSRPPALDAARKAFGGHVGVPLVTAMAQVVDTAQVDKLLETELVAQCATAVVPGFRVEHDANFTARFVDADHGVGKTRAQALGKDGGNFPGHQR